MKRSIYALLLCFGLLGFCAWDDGCGPSADDTMSQRQEMAQTQAVASIGLPSTPNFTEMRLVKYLYELRDQKIVTYAYVPNMQGQLYHLCDSIGYGLPYGVQFSSPEKHSGYQYALPQAEPNGLFMPPTAEGTWIMCADKTKAGGIDPVYVEPRVIVSPFKLTSIGEYAAR